MIKLFYGNDTVAVREAAFALVSERRALGASVSSIAAETYEVGELASVAEAGSLFGEDLVYVVDSLFQNPDGQEELLAVLPRLVSSPHTFVIIEGALLAADKKKLIPAADFSEEFQAVKAERFNIFALAEALAKKDRRTLWLLLLSARRAGVSDEEIIGIMWWQLKTLRLVRLTESAAEAGLKDFPYQKAKQRLAGFRPGELEMLAQKLLTLYHDGHGGRRHLALALEEFVLKV